MSTLTVRNIQTTGSLIPLTITTGNSSAGRIVINANDVLLFANSTTNVTINSASISIAGVTKVSSSPVSGTSSSGNQVTLVQQLILSGNVTPTKLAANTSAWNQASSVYNIRAEANSTTVYYSLFGITAGLNGQEITVTNINATPIFIRNEDSDNEATASNRFSMPNHIKLDGYMAAQFYYDGNSTRWRLIDSINIPSDYKSQLTKGFFSGGANPGVVARADRTTYSSETTAAVTGANLSQGRYYMQGAGNDVKAFIAGGITPTIVATADRTTYSSEATAAVSGANLSQARTSLTAAGNADKGFFAAGTTPTIVATADRTRYSTETTAAVAGANLSQARGDLAAVGNSDKGFFSGGESPARVTTSGRTNYSTETHAAVTGANLSQARSLLYATGNGDKGFFIGGFATADVSTADKTTYSTETTAAVSGANLSQVRYAHSAAGNGDKGFFMSGFATPVFVVTADRTTYSSETTAAVSGANIGQSRAGMAGI